MCRKKDKKLVARQLLAVYPYCYICRNDLSADDPDMTKDHVFPESHGHGLRQNMMPAHQACNFMKGDRLPTYEELELAIATYDALGWFFNPIHKSEAIFCRKNFNYFLHRKDDHV